MKNLLFYDPNNPEKAVLPDHSADSLRISEVGKWKQKAKSYAHLIPPVLTTIVNGIILWLT
ncbi:hypothetical protein [Rhodoflexus sp.]